jgi:hypothetical protein
MTVPHVVYRWLRPVSIPRHRWTVKGDADRPEADLVPGPRTGWSAYDQMSAMGEEHRTRTRKEQMRSMGQVVSLPEPSILVLGSAVNGTKVRI